jgi:glyoxylate utilization-related uncharacterized protein
MARENGDQHKILLPVNHMLEDEGLMHIEGKDHLMHKQDYIFMPPGADHAISIARLVDWCFRAVTSPMTDSQSGMILGQRILHILGVA